MERPKMGFGFPIGAMLRGPLRPWAEELLDEARLRAAGSARSRADPAGVAPAPRGRRDLAYELWAVLALQAWLERWEPPGR